jgi:hypothetical protein
MLQMQTYITVVLLLSSGAVRAGLEKVLKLAEFIADIYQQLPRRCIFIINCETQQQGENSFCIICISFLLLVNRNLLTVTWERKCLCVFTPDMKVLFATTLFYWMQVYMSGTCDV